MPSSEGHRSAVHKPPQLLFPPSHPPDPRLCKLKMKIDCPGNASGSSSVSRVMSIPPLCLRRRFLLALAGNKRTGQDGKLRTPVVVPVFPFRCAGGNCPAVFFVVVVVVAALIYLYIFCHFLLFLSLDERDLFFFVLEPHTADATSIQLNNVSSSICPRGRTANDCCPSHPFESLLSI